MAIYKINTNAITKPATADIGKIIDSSISNLTEETYSLSQGTVKEGTTAIEGAAVVLIEIDSTSSTETSKAISYTDADGRFGIPYEFDDTATISYRLDVYTPNPLV